MILFFDTETNGLVQKRLPVDHPTQPRLLQLGLVLADDDGVERGCINLTVRPDGWTIPEAAIKSHGITTEIAASCGVTVEVALACYSQMQRLSNEIVAHNLDFDERIMATAFARYGRGPVGPFPPKRSCTMRLAKSVLKIPPTDRMLAAGFGPEDYKSPSLSECYQTFFGEELTGAHDALTDARACARVYFHLRSLQTA